MLSAFPMRIIIDVTISTSHSLPFFILFYFVKKKKCFARYCDGHLSCFGTINSPVQLLLSSSLVNSGKRNRRSNICAWDSTERVCVLQLLSVHQLSNFFFCANSTGFVSVKTSANDAPLVTCYPTWCRYYRNAVFCCGMRTSTAFFGWVLSAAVSRWVGVVCCCHRLQYSPGRQK